MILPNLIIVRKKISEGHIINGKLKRYNNRKFKAFRMIIIKSKVEEVGRECKQIRNLKK